MVSVCFISCFVLVYALSVYLVCMHVRGCSRFVLYLFNEIIQVELVVAQHSQWLVAPVYHGNGAKSDGDAGLVPRPQFPAGGADRVVADGEVEHVTCSVRVRRHRWVSGCVVGDAGGGGGGDGDDSLVWLF